MNTAESAELVRAGRRKEAGQRGQFQHPHVPARAAGAQPGAKRRDGRPVHPARLVSAGLAAAATDWNWRLEPGIGRQLRAVGDIGSHWLDLMTFISGAASRRSLSPIFRPSTPFAKSRPNRWKPSPARCLRPEDYVDQPIHTEDYATILLHYENGVRGVLTVSQVCSGRKNRLFFEINGSKSSLAWDGSARTNCGSAIATSPTRLLLKDPALLSPEAPRKPSPIPADMMRASRTPSSSSTRRFMTTSWLAITAKQPDFPTFADGHYEMQLSEAIERSAREKTWVKR